MRRRSERTRPVPEDFPAPTALRTGAVLAIAWLLLFAAAPGRAADATRPHPHRGLLEPFEGAPARLERAAEERAQLAAGRPVLRQIESRSGGRGMAVQDIRARPETIWGRIGDFRSYPRMVKHVRECEPYVERPHDVRVRFVIRVLGLRYEYYVKHAFHPEQGWVTWTLDYTRESDLDDSVGYWAVEALGSKPGWSRLFYSIDMRTRGWMPGFLRRMIAGEGLRDATQWVKRESEAEQTRLDSLPFQDEDSSAEGAPPTVDVAPSEESSK